MTKSRYSEAQSFLNGLSRTLDIGSTQSKSASRKMGSLNSDKNSIKSDWKNVGNDIRESIKKANG